jgi:hypothetical protein
MAVSVDDALALDRIRMGGINGMIRAAGRRADDERGRGQTSEISHQTSGMGEWRWERRRVVGDA